MIILNNSLYSLISPFLAKINLCVKRLTHITNTDPCNWGLVIVWLGEWGVVRGELIVPEDGVWRDEETPGNRLGCSRWRIVCWIIGGVHSLLDREGGGSGVVLIFQEVVELWHVSHDGELVRHISVEHVLRVQQTWDAKLLLRHPVSKNVVLQDVLLTETAIVKQRGPEVVDQGTECQAIPPRGAHVQDVHILIWVSNTPTPDLKCSHSSSFNWHVECVQIDRLLVEYSCTHTSYHTAAYKQW